MTKKAWTPEMLEEIDALGHDFKLAGESRDFGLFPKLQAFATKHGRHVNNVSSRFYSRRRKWKPRDAAKYFRRLQTEAGVGD